MVVLQYSTCHVPSSVCRAGLHSLPPSFPSVFTAAAPPAVWSGAERGQCAQVGDTV